MSLCNGGIMANSSFSWWAAYLAENKNKKIIGPSFKRIKNIKRLSWWHKEIMPKNWQQI